MPRYDVSTPEARAQQRVDDRAALIWHAAIFVLVNMFIWIQDVVSGGVDYAYWVTAPWALGLAFHAISYNLDRSDANHRRYEEFLAEERERQRERDLQAH